MSNEQKTGMCQWCGQTFPFDEMIASAIGGSYRFCRKHAEYIRKKQNVPASHGRCGNSLKSRGSPHAG